MCYFVLCPAVCPCSYIDEILPAVFRPSLENASTLRSIWSAILANHPYITFFTATGPEARVQRLRLGLYLLTIQDMLMFIMAVFFNLQFPDNGEFCADFSVKDECEADSSMFDESVSTCTWADDVVSSYDGTVGVCQARDVTMTVKVRFWDCILFVVLFYN